MPTVNDLLGPDPKAAPVKPTVDSLLGPAPKPTVDSLLGPAPAKAPAPKPSALKKEPGFLDAGGALNRVFPNAKDIGDTLSRRSKESVDAIKEDFTTPATKKGTKVTPFDVPLRVGKTALDVVGVPFQGVAAAGEEFVGRPYQAAVDAVAGHPVPNAKAAMGDALSMFTPMGAPKAVGLAAKTATKAGKAAGPAAMAAHLALTPAAEEAATAAASHPARSTMEAAFKGKKAEGVAGDIQKTFAPATRGTEAKVTAATLKKGQATAELLTDREAARLLKSDKALAPLSEMDRRALIHHIETASDGSVLPDHLQKFSSAVKDIRASFDRTANRLTEVLAKDGESPNLIRDYYTHMWEQPPEEVEKAMANFVPKQGSGRNLMRRSIPTVEDGIAAGLKPKTLNPIETTLLYQANMNRFIETRSALDTLKEYGYAKYFPENKAPPGYVPLEGVGTKVPAMANEAGVAQPKKLYAPEDVARVWNNNISKGFDSSTYKALRGASNGMAALKLGLSAYHAGTMGMEAGMSSMAGAFNALAEGKPLTAATRAAKTPLAFALTPLKGNKVRNALLNNTSTGDKFLDEAARLYVDSGGRLNMDKQYRAVERAGFYQALKKGTFVRELQEVAKGIYGPNLKGSERAMNTARLFGNALQSVSGPLFEDYIPRLKVGAFSERMSDWLKANPGAS